MRAILSVFLVLLLCGAALAAPYGDYDLRKAIVSADPATGRKEAVDGAYLQRMISDLYDHAGSYPPKFDNKQDMERARRDAAVLLKAMPIFADDLKDDQVLQLVTGATGAVAHNLDLPGGDAVARKYLGRLLELNPDHGPGNQFLGVHLMGSNAVQESLPHLKKARAQGVSEADYSLAVASLMLDDRKAAEEYLVEFLAKRPGDQQAERLLKAVRDPKGRFGQKAK